MKKCITCDKVILKLPAESYKQHEERVYCSPICRSKGQRMYVPEKRCLVCGEKFDRNLYRDACEYMVAKYCSRECAGKAKRAEWKRKFCRFCGKELKQKRWYKNGKLFKETHYKFSHRKFCNKRCRGLFDFNRETNKKEIHECKFCGLPIVRKKYFNRNTNQPYPEKYDIFINRMFCNNICKRRAASFMKDIRSEERTRSVWKNGQSLQRSASTAVKLFIQRIMAKTTESARLCSSVDCSAQEHAHIQEEKKIQGLENTTIVNSALDVEKNSSEEMLKI